MTIRLPEEIITTPATYTIVRHPGRGARATLDHNELAPKVKAYSDGTVELVMPYATVTTDGAWLIMPADQARALGEALLIMTEQD